MAKLDLTKYGITGTTEVVYNPSYEQLFEEETKPGLEGYEKGQVSELGAVNVMTGIYTGRSPKDKFIVMDENQKGAAQPMKKYGCVFSCLSLYMNRPQNQPVQGRLFCETNKFH